MKRVHVLISNTFENELQSMKHLKMNSPYFVFEMSTFKKDPRPFWWIFGRLWPRKDWPKPTTFHYFLTLLERHGILLKCYTQNIDGLEEVAGLSHEKLVNCHGVLSPCHCLDCGKEIPLSYCIFIVIKIFLNVIF